MPSQSVQEGPMAVTSCITDQIDLIPTEKVNASKCKGAAAIKAAEIKHPEFRTFGATRLDVRRSDCSGRSARCR